MIALLRALHKRVPERLIGNALANLGRGAAAGIAALLLPPFLIRHMTPVEYGVWVLVLQTAAYAVYLELGLQTAVGRHVAYAGSAKDTKLRDSVYNTAFAALLVACAVCLLLLLLALVFLPAIFPDIPAATVTPMRWTLLIVGISTALGLPASAFNGVFIGLQRHEIPAMTVGLSRLVSAAGLAYMVWRGSSIVAMACLLACCNLLSYAVQYGALRRLLPELRNDFHLVSKETGRLLAGYCLGLVSMSVGMLLVRGCDLVLVGRFEFGAVPTYSAAASIITFLGGMLCAVITVMLPHAAKLHARQEARQLGTLVVSSTRLSVLLLIFVSCPLIFYSDAILGFWMGAPVSTTARLVLVVLVTANVIRLVGAPYSIILVGAGKARLVSVSPLAEGVSNFGASVFLGIAMGSLGVALGTLAGSMVSIGAHLFYSMPRTRSDIRFSPREYLGSGILKPLVVTSPLIVASSLAITGFQMPHWGLLVCFVLSSAGGLFLLASSDRTQFAWIDRWLSTPVRIRPGCDCGLDAASRPAELPE